MTDLQMQIALIAAGAALLGTLIAAGLALWGVHLQTKRARELEDLRRIREVREKRIDKIEDAINNSINTSWKTLDILIELAKDNPNRIFVEKEVNEFVSKLSNMDFQRERLQVQSGRSLQDKVLDELLDEFGMYFADINKFNMSISSTKLNTGIRGDKEIMEKCETLRNKLMDFSTRFINRLDYLRTK